MAIAPDGVSYESHGLRVRVQGDSGLFDVTRGFQESSFFFFFFNQKPKGVYMCPIKKGLRSLTDQKGQIPQLTLDCINT